MTAREVALTRFTLSNAYAVVLGVLALVLAFTGISVDAVATPEGDRGLALTSPNNWFEPGGFATFFVTLCLLGLTCWALWFMTMQFNILRAYSVSHIGLFLVMTASMPTLTGALQGGTLLAPVMIVSMMLLYSCYNNPGTSSRRVFAAFLLTSCGTLVQYGFTVYLPILFVGCAQMRVLNVRNMLAGLIGIATPWWLWWAFDGTPLTSPQFLFELEGADIIEALPSVAAIGLTLLVGVVTGFFASAKIYSFNARARAFNGLLTVVSLVTALMLFVDFTNFIFYVTLLNALGAIQIAHYDEIYASKRAYLFMLVLPVAYTAIFIWRVVAL